MKQKWEQIAGKIDALALRERAILFTVISLAVIVLINSLLIEPQFSKQKLLSDKMQQEQLQISALQLEITQRVVGKRVDPDAENKQRWEALRLQLAQVDSSLQTMQKNLVQPERMSLLLEGLLKRNHKLQLVALKNLPVVNVIEELSTGAAVTKLMAPGSPAVPAASGAIYKHEVELVLQGNYLDMLSYMRELENLPEQVYWNKGKMTVLEYPKANLTLNLFTLSLDKKWLNL